VLGDVGHALVVRHERSEVAAELLGGCEVQCVQRSERRGQQSAGSFENPIVEPNEVDAPEDASTSRDGLVSSRQQCTKDFRARQRARYQWPSTLQVAT
jgi:hypothetical protein